MTHPADPQFVMDSVKLLVSDITSPETAVKFVPPSRADSATIQNNIAPPAITWTWQDDVARQAQTVTLDDVGKYGYQADVNTQFRLTSVTPIVWQPFLTGTIATWTWKNATERVNERVLVADVGKNGIQTDTNVLYQLIAATPAVWKPIPNPTNTSAPFELSQGASDADSYHDFFRLQVAFQDVWAELFDTRIAKAGELLYAMWDALMDTTLDDSDAPDRAKRFPNPPTGDISGADELTAFIAFLKLEMGLESGGPADTSAELTKIKNDLALTLQGCNMLLKAVNRVGQFGPAYPGDKAWGDEWWTNTEADTKDMMDIADPNLQRKAVFSTILNDLQAVSVGPGQDVSFPDLQNLLDELTAILKERYRFEVFAPASINYGLLLNYRQHWQPQSYQVGNLVSTIPLAPGETRRYTTKTVVKKSRSVKEIDASVSSGKSESSETSRVDSEIVDRAKNQTNFQRNASGSFGNDNPYKVVVVGNGQNVTVDAGP